MRQSSSEMQLRQQQQNFDNPGNGLMNVKYDAKSTPALAGLDYKVVIVCL